MFFATLKNLMSNTDKFTFLLNLPVVLNNESQNQDSYNALRAFQAYFFERMPPSKKEGFSDLKVLLLLKLFPLNMFNIN